MRTRESSTVASTVTTPAAHDWEQEIVNGLTHGLGAVLSVIGLWSLISMTSARGTAWHLVGCGIYGCTLVALYTASTLYHSTSHPEWKEWLRVVDHLSIYLLIAGTYTPFTLLVLPRPWGPILLTAIWLLAALGIAFKLRFWSQYEVVSLVLYLAMGWLGLVAAKPLVETMPFSAVMWLVGGGLLYSLGTIFYVLDSRRFFHAIWHLFVMGGSALHFVAVVLYVVPMAR